MDITQLAHVRMPCLGLRNCLRPCLRVGLFGKMLRCPQAASNNTAVVDSRQLVVGGLSHPGFHGLLPEPVTPPLRQLHALAPA